MTLKDYYFRPDYNKIDNNIASEFYLPCMENSVIYNRISGYFGSTVYIIAWPALKVFVNNKGKIRIICSPFIIDSDQEAINEGYNARKSEEISNLLIDEINCLFENPYLNKPTRALACLVATNIIDLKVAIIKPEASPKAKHLFHDKIGIFADSEENIVGFRGSMNETFKGLASDGNIESIDVFPNWLDIRDKQRAESAIDYFNQLWNNNIQNIEVYDFPRAAKNIFLKYTKSDNWEELVNEITVEIKKEDFWNPEKGQNGRKPRKHQVEALETWESRGKRGILKHATGSGKTYTALCAIRKSLETNEIVLLLVPSTELLSQWKEEIISIFRDIDLKILTCGDGNNTWKSRNTLFSWTKNGLSKPRIVISTMATASTDTFLASICQGEHIFIVADEVHRMGSMQHRKILQLNTGPRLGLSATPERYGDLTGTQSILSYFEGIIQPEFNLEDAIKVGFLTKYMYHPQTVMLSKEEQDNWDEITKRISILIANKQKRNEDISFIDDNALKRLLIRRSSILKNAAAKPKVALDIIKTNFTKGDRWIVYCDNQSQLQEVLAILNASKFDAVEYHSSMQGDRKETLRYFENNGGILVSIKCLDEGVNIPAATHALILASSKNPREFIQRRGRILRKAKNKHLSHLFDTIVLPNKINPDTLKEVSIIESELSRAIQFGKGAENPACISKLEMIAIDYGIDINNFVEGGYDDE